MFTVQRKRFTQKNRVGVHVYFYNVRILVKIFIMVTKLILSMNEETIQRAKRISKKRGKSVSKLFEEYVNSITFHLKRSLDFR